MTVFEGLFYNIGENQCQGEEKWELGGENLWAYVTGSLKTRKKIKNSLREKKKLFNLVKSQKYHENTVCS